VASLTLLVRNTTDPGALTSAPALTFDGARVVIGRGQGCDVRLPDPSVSHRHATIRLERGKHALVDEGSTNGTFVGGVRLAPSTPRALRSGDLVRVGRVWLEVRLDETPPTRDLAMATRDLALLLVSQAMEALGDDVVPKVRVVEGPDLGAEVALTDEGRAYVVGRGEGCDLPLADGDASREHVQLVRRGQTVLVRDLGSKNGVLLGEARLPRNRDVPWKATSMLRAARTVLALEEPVAAALGTLEDANDEPMADEDAPPAPASALGARRSVERSDEGPPTGGERPPADGPASAAPIADLAAASRKAAANATTVRKRRGSWSKADFAVIAAALAVIALSVAGLVWLLRG
jgi:pSer/pThr/pTyr-binding forkhead associated (FHA) protein